jgi:hypothetical protein
MPWVLPKPSESGYGLGVQNFWNQIQSTLQLMQGIINTLPALYKLFQEARAMRDYGAARLIEERINELFASMPRTPLGTIPTTAAQLAASLNLSKRGFVGRDVYPRYLVGLYNRQIPYSQVFPRPISQEDDSNVVNVGGFVFPSEFLEQLQMEPQIRRAEAEMRAAEDLERALEQPPQDVRSRVRTTGQRRRHSTTEKLEGIDLSNRSGARIMRSLAGGTGKQQGSANVSGVWLSPELMWFLQNQAAIMRFLQEALPGQTSGKTESERMPGSASPDERQYIMWLSEQLRKWRQEP